MARVVKVEYRLGDIAPSTSGIVLESKLTPQPCLLREVHVQGDPSTNFNIKIFDSERRLMVDKVFEAANIDKELHVSLSPSRLIHDVEKSRIWFEVDNNDTLNLCRLMVKLVIEVMDGE